jgi:hypothetical protein
MQYKNPMRFFHILTPTNWLKVAFCSLVLASGSAWYLLSYHATGADIATSITTFFSPSSAPLRPTNSPSTQQLPPLAAPPETAQTHSVAPAGILDQYAQFTEVNDFDDTPIKPSYSLPAAVAPTGLLDPLWNGSTP